MESLARRYEEIAIAAWLLALWRSERQASGRSQPQRFVDLGCGNGFLTYLLIEEGHAGWGIDRQRRKIWGEYPAAVSRNDATGNSVAFLVSQERLSLLRLVRVLLLFSTQPNRPTPKH